MLKAGDEFGEALNGDYSEKEKAELFGKAAVMMILASLCIYGFMELIMQPDMLRSIVTESKEAIGEKFREISNKARAILKEDDLVVVIENWQEIGDISKAVQLGINWIKWMGWNKVSSVDDIALKHSALGEFTYDSKTDAELQP